jgi:hypothetical protein
MARDIGNDEKVYRAVITRRKYVPNPNYRIVYDAHGSHAEGGDRYIYSDTETYTTIYGVYDTAAPAKAHITKAVKRAHGETDPAFVGATLQVGTVHWEDVPSG